MKVMTRYILIATAALAVAALLACKGDQQVQPPAAEGRCPKLEGSYFGADKSEISRGEVVTLRYKVPRVYAPNIRVEGEGVPELPNLPPPEISGFTANPTASPITLPEWYEGETTGVRPQQTTTFKLEATAPQGCQSLELTAQVNVRGE